MANITFTEGSGLNDSIYGKSQQPIRLFIEKKGEAFEEESMLPHLFCMENSNHFGEKFTSMTAMDGFSPVGENGASPVDGMQESYTKFFEHMTWKDSFSLSREIVEDSKLIDLRKKPSAFVTGYYRTRERFGSALYSGAMELKSKVAFGGREFDITCADGKALFSTGHTSKLNSKTQANLFADEFSADALAACECQMQNFRGDNGELLCVIPDTIMIPNNYELKKAVFSVIGAECDPATSNNGYNYHFGRWNVVVNPYLDVTGNYWILMDSKYNRENAGAVWLDRTPLDVRSVVDDNTSANIWYGYARFIAGFNDWRFAAIGGIAVGNTLVKTTTTTTTTGN